MAFKKVSERKERELITLIDIVFLLLIFFLVTTGFEAAEEKHGPKIEEKYPEILGTPIDTQNPLDKLVIAFDYRDSEQVRGAPDVVYVLWPLDLLDIENRLTFDKAFEQAREDDILSIDLPQPIQNNSLEGVRDLIDNWIHRYKFDILDQQQAFQPVVEIAAVKETPFTLINYVMTICGEEDVDIKDIAFRAIHKR